MVERRHKSADLLVISPHRAWTCSVCGVDQEGWLTMEDSGPVCMACADMAHLVLVPSGDAAITGVD